MEETKKENKIIRILLIIINLIIWALCIITMKLFYSIVKAETINTDYNYIQSITQQWGIGQSGYGNYLIDYLNFTWGYQWTPVYSNNQEIPLQPSDYEVYINYDIVVNNNWPYIPTYEIQVYNNGWVNATCDGNITDNLISQSYQGTWTRYNFEYKCDLLHVTNTFSTIRLRTYSTIVTNPYSTVEFQLNTSQLLDKKEISTGDQAIINEINNFWNNFNQTFNDEMDATYTPQTPNKANYDQVEQAETTLHTYTNVDLSGINVDLDSDTNSWVWNTLTTLLNTNALVFGMVISILSIGIMKLILNR